MMGEKDPQLELYYNLSLEGFVPNDHPLRRIRPLVDDEAIRKHCRELYSPIGRPSIPPEQLFLALLAGYVMGITSERRLVMELQCNMALRWFVGLNLSQERLGPLDVQSEPAPALRQGRHDAVAVRPDHQEGAGGRAGQPARIG